MLYSGVSLGLPNDIIDASRVLRKPVQLVSARTAQASRIVELELLAVVYLVRKEHAWEELEEVFF